ncbi:MAG: aspartate kinase [Patescibacteria group bacterium]|nr:aspartate kinase [Patescibacteria group bacterium]
MEVMKFGGTSLGNAMRIMHAAGIVQSHAVTGPVLVVVSAMAGITDTLVCISEHHSAGEYAKRDALTALVSKKHQDSLEELELPSSLYAETRKELDVLLNRFIEQLSVFASPLLPHEVDFVVSYGERLSSLLVSAALRKKGVAARHVFGSDVLVASEEYGNASALMDESRKRSSQVLQPLFARGITPVVTGFFGGTAAGTVATFGRGGSDYSAAVLAAVLGADRLTVWKEVDGVFTADPKTDIHARFIERLSYAKAARMARAGAKVLHPECMEPVRAMKIPVYVRNTFRPEFPGTLIYA